MQNKLPADKIWQEWMRKAEDDELNAKVILKSREGTPNIVGVLSQQMAEKCLEGLLIFYKQDYPKIHDLVRIANLLDPFTPGIFDLIEKLKLNELSELYIIDRYPSDIPELNWEQAEDAFETARKIRDFVINIITTP